MENYAQEVDRFEEFLEKQYQLVLTQNETYQEYVGIPVLLSECLADITHNSAIYICYRTMRLASEAAEGKEFQLGEKEDEYLKEMHQVFIKFILERVLESYPQELNNIPSEEDFQNLVDNVFQTSLQHTLETFQVEEKTEEATEDSQK